MPISITLSDALVDGLSVQAEQEQVSIEQLAIGILTEAVAAKEALTEVIDRIRATPPNPDAIRAPQGDLAALLQTEPQAPPFDPDEWRRQWSIFEAELKSISRANDIAEGRGGENGT